MYLDFTNPNDMPDDFKHVIKAEFWRREIAVGGNSISLKASLLGRVEGDLDPACLITLTQKINGEEDKVRSSFILGLMTLSGYEDKSEEIWKEFLSL